MILFLCETKSQIVNAIALKMSLFADEKADLCLIRKVAMPEYYEGKIKEIRMFDSVYSVEPEYFPQQDLFSMMKKAFQYAAKVKYLYSLLEGKLRNYSLVFVSGLGTDAPAIYYAVRKQNPKVKLYLYEEGTFEYYMFQYVWNSWRKWYSRIFYGDFYLDDAERLYVYEPKMVLSPPMHIKVMAIPKLFKDERYKKYVNNIFDYNSEGLETFNSNKCIFLESCYDDEQLARIQYNIINLIFDAIGDKLVVKLHPRSEKNKYEAIGVCQLKTNQSMEMILLNKNVSFENLVFISPLSSALLNIKLMFRFEPKMIILNNLLNMSTNVGGIQYLAEEFANQYAKDRLYHPIDLNSLKIVLDELFGRDNQ